MGTAFSFDASLIMAVVLLVPCLIHGVRRHFFLVSVRNDARFVTGILAGLSLNTWATLLRLSP